MAGLESEHLSEVSRLLGGRKTLAGRGRVPTASAFVDAIRAGLPSAALEALVDQTHLHPASLTELLGMSERTWARRKAAKGRLTPVESDRLFRVARAIARATEVLGSREKAVRWFEKPNRALGGDVPFTLLDTEIGEQQIMAVLDRIEHGVFG